jgi:hypothetical protein
MVTNYMMSSNKKELLDGVQDWEQKGENIVVQTLFPMRLF